MNKLIRTSAAALAAFGLLMGMSTAAQAQEASDQRAMTGVGLVIAAQGNAALKEIRDELREQIEQTLQPLSLPAQGLADAPQVMAPEQAA